MPLVTWDNLADFDTHYSIRARGVSVKVKLGYHRHVMLPIIRARAAHLVAAFPELIAPGVTVAVFGSGYAWLAEELEALGVSEAIGIDTSSYIQSTKDQTEVSEISDRLFNQLGDANHPALSSLHDNGNKARRQVLNETLSNNGSRNRVRQALTKGDVDFIVSETLLESLTDTEAVQASSLAVQVTPNVIHIVIPLVQRKFDAGGQDPLFNWKTLADWKTLLPTDEFMSVNGEVA